MSKASTDRQLTLSDGRNLSFSDIGTSENGVWIHCHGIPGSRNELSHLEQTLVNAKVRVIVPDRPGYGRSGSHSNYGFDAHAEDIRQLADYLQLGRFRLSGFSGGGVFAMAAAAVLGERIEQLALAATPAVPLMDDPYKHASELTGNTWRAAKADPQALARELPALTGSAEVLSNAMIEAAGEPDAQYLLSASIYPGFLISLQTALEQGPRVSANALARDMFLAAHAWPFRLEDIEAPVRLIHGDADGLVYRHHQAVLNDHFRHCQPYCIRGGHYATLSVIWDLGGRGAKALG
jgi:pimeloyl-ACP methyl ester carboxylesterase